MNNTIQLVHDDDINNPVRTVTIDIPLDPAISKPARIWSDEQKLIFVYYQTGTGNAVVQARAGTGKTTTIKQAFTYAPESRILYAVFGNRNKREAEAAISDSRVDILTLHALGLRFIKRVWNYVNVDKTAGVEFDRAQQACGFNAPDGVVAAVKKLMSLAKNRFVGLPTFDALLDLAECQDVDISEFSDLGYNNQRLVDCTLKALELSKVRDAQSRISFDDMVWLPVACNWVKPIYNLVTIDEAQDMSLPQITMAKRSSSGRIVVVGDDRQTIFLFRGALLGCLEYHEAGTKRASIHLNDYLPLP